MSTNYAFHNNLGAAYRGGSLEFVGRTLLCPAGNRVAAHDLAAGVARTLGAETMHSGESPCHRDRTAAPNAPPPAV